jgi:TPR repeat protein
MGSMYNSARVDGLHDFAVSESWFLRGAEQGDSDCLYGLGRLYAYGGMCQDNYGRDAEKALYYLQQAGERGDALNVLGELYRSGVASNDWTYAEDGGLTFRTALEADPARALDCFRRALECESPSEFALDNLVSLGKDLQEGRGMEQNTELAKEAFRIAAEHGSEEAQQLMQSLG